MLFTNLFSRVSSRCSSRSPSDAYAPAMHRKRPTDKPHVERLEDRTLLCAPGDLDLTFGTGGVVTTPIGIGNDRAHAVAIDASGRIVTAGYSRVAASQNIPSHLDIAVVRYSASGILDSSFDGDGKVTTEFNTRKKSRNDDVANASAIQPDGKIIVAGNACRQRLDAPDQKRNQFGLARYNLDGSLDATFGTAGKVITPLMPDSLGADEFAYGVAIDSSGKIIAVGQSTGTGGDRVFGLVRYNVDGSLDAGFGSSGVVTTDIGSGPNDTARGVAVQADDKIVVAGHCSGTTTDVCVARYVGASGAVASARAVRDGTSQDVHATGTDLVIEDLLRNKHRGRLNFWRRTDAEALFDLVREMER